MKDVVIFTYCDRHRARGEEGIEGETTRPLLIDGVYRTIDLCEVCRKEMIDPLAELLEEFGEKPEGVLGRPRVNLGLDPEPGPRDRNRSAAKMWSCPLCEEELKKGSAVSHVWGRHLHMSIPTQPEQCPDCDYTSPRAAAMGQHRTARHGYDSLALALALATERAGQDDEPAPSLLLPKPGSELDEAALALAHDQPVKPRRRRVATPV